MSVSKHLQDKLALLPDSPGCYIMKDENQNILYVGKAKVLKNRVRSYFHGTHNNKTTRLVSHIRDFEFIVTGSEKEALLLEINLIKKHTPPYNIMFMDDKTYPYIEITKENNFVVRTTRNIKNKKSEYFGPYPSSQSAYEIVKLINQIFCVRKCRHIPDSPCLYYHMHQCLGPCIHEIDPKENEVTRKKIKKFLQGDTKEVMDSLQAKMMEASENLQFEKAQEILRGRNDAFNLNHERQSNKYLFSTLIKCKECGWSFRRTVRTYKNTYVRWVCSGRNGKGADSCPNKTVVDEEELIQVLQEYFNRVLQQKNKVIDYVVKEFQRVYKAKDENAEYEKELDLQIARLQRMRQKYMDMYTDDLISREELNDKLGGTRQELDRLENELKMVSSNLTKGDQMEKILNDTFKQIEDITDVHEMTNVQLKRLIKKIEVDKDGNVDIYLRLLGDLGLNESILVEDECENKTALNSDDQT